MLSNILYHILALSVFYQLYPLFYTPLWALWSGIFNYAYYCPEEGEKLDFLLIQIIQCKNVYV